MSVVKERLNKSASCSEMSFLSIFRRYVDDSHARFTSKYHANTFKEILNKQDPAIQYTIEYENENKLFGR